MCPGFASGFGVRLFGVALGLSADHPLYAAERQQVAEVRRVDVDRRRHRRAVRRDAVAGSCRRSRRRLVTGVSSIRVIVLATSLQHLAQDRLGHVTVGRERMARREKPGLNVLAVDAGRELCVRAIPSADVVLHRLVRLRAAVDVSAKHRLRFVPARQTLRRRLAADVAARVNQDDRLAVARRRKAAETPPKLAPTITISKSKFTRGPPKRVELAGAWRSPGEHLPARLRYVGRTVSQAAWEWRSMSTRTGSRDSTKSRV